MIRRSIHAPLSLTIDPRRLREQMVQRIEARLGAQGIMAPAVLTAMRKVPRHLFVQEALRSRAYEEQTLPIGYGQTISQPSVVALMSAALEASAGMRVLEIGTGSGYQAAVLAAMGCKVYTVERIRELYHATAALLRHMGVRHVHTKRDDGTMGMPEAAPFDRIIVTAGGPEIPAPLVGQLTTSGILVIPVGGKKREQRLLRVHKQPGGAYVEDLGSAAFVDLVGSHGW